MYEVELKAHVVDRAAVIVQLNTFATPGETVHKDDVYWEQRKRRPLSDHITRHAPVKIRVRHQTTGTGASQQEQILLTYKRKERRTDSDGTTVEVNDEKECTVSAAAPIESFLSDCGFVPGLHKQKSVISWHFDGILIELCTVPPLGDFLELEIMSSNDDDKTIALQRQRLLKVLDKAGISECDIESRYYSELLKRKEKNVRS